MRIRTLQYNAIIFGAIAVFLPILLLGCFRKSNNRNFNPKISQQIFFDTINTTLLIENTHNFSVKFNLKINNQFPLGTTQVKNIVEDISIKNKIPIEQAAWVFTNQKTYKNLPLTSNNWQHNPLLFLNSIGGGFCDDRATVLASIWKLWFDSVRIVELNGHVVAEVKANDKWQMFDADHSIAYLNSKDEVCSIKELEDSSQWIYSPKSEKQLGENVLYQYTTPLTKRFAQYYSSSNDNSNSYTLYSILENYDSLFSLPSNSTLELQINQYPHRSRLLVHLSTLSKGELQIPFVPFSAKGSFTFLSNKISKTITSNDYRFQLDSFLNSITIASVSNKSTIEYLINPKVNLLLQKNLLNLKNTDSLKINVVRNSHTQQPKLFGTEGQYFDLVCQVHKKEIAEWSKLNVEQMNGNDIRELFYHFISKDSNLNATQVSAKMKTFDALMNIEASNPNGLQDFKNTYPKSALFLFTAIKDGKESYLK